MKWLLIIIALYLVVSEIIAAAIRSRRKWGDKVFKSNGCSGLFIPQGNWGECCQTHDANYRRGGWAIARLKADIQLFKCIASNKNLFAATLYFTGVRFAGQYAFQYGTKRELIIGDE
jgi:hypothetical protein